MYDEFVPLSDILNYIDHSGVYEIVCRQNGRVYIGQSTSVTHRAKQHLDNLEGDRHSNQLLQHDWNRLDSDEFQFRLVAEIPYTNAAELRKQELREMARRRKHGIQLYNDFRVVGDPSTPLEVKVATEAELRKKRVKAEQAARDYQTTKKKYDWAQNAEYKRPRDIDLSGYEEATCYDCGMPGGLNLQIFRCDDKVLRCERCTDKHLGSQKGWMDLAQPTERNASNSYRRWMMASSNHAREAKLALSSYIRRFATRPKTIYVSREFVGNKAKLEKEIGLQIRNGQYTPKGYFDLPCPERSDTLGENGTSGLQKQ